MAGNVGNDVLAKEALLLLKREAMQGDETAQRIFKMAYKKVKEAL